MPGKGKLPLPGSAEERKAKQAYNAEMARRKAEEEKLAAEAAQAAAKAEEQKLQAERKENARLEEIRVAKQAAENAAVAEWTKAQAKAFKADLRQQAAQYKAERLWLEAGTHVSVDYLGHSFVVPRRLLKSEP